MGRVFKEFKCLVENQLNKKIKILRSFGGGEYIGNEFDFFLKQSGIRHQTTHSYTPKLNCLSERMNRTIVNNDVNKMFVVRCKFSQRVLDRICQHCRIFD